MKAHRRIRYVQATPLEIKTMLEALTAFEETKRRQDLEFEEIIKTANLIRKVARVAPQGMHRDVGRMEERDGSVLLKLREKESHEVLCKALDELNKAKKTSDRTFAVYTKVYNAPTSFTPKEKSYQEYER